MAASSTSFIVGLIGNIIAILVFTSPIKTFAGIVKKKSTEDYKGVPYIITLLSTSLWTFYGLLKTDGLLIVTVNGAGVMFQSIYVVLFLTFAPRDKKISTAILVGIMNIGFLGAVIAITLLALPKSHEKITFVGTLCMGLTIGMYAAPLSAMRMVIQTKSVMYMPFLLSFCLFLNGGVWSVYAVLVNDIYIIVPNAIGLVLGTAQLVIYMVYNDKSDEATSDDEIDKEVGLVDFDYHVEKEKVKMQKLTIDESNYSVHKIEEKGKNIEDKEDEEENDGSKGPNLSKLVSLPKPSVNRMDSVKKMMRTISNISPYDLDSNWATTTGAKVGGDTPASQQQQKIKCDTPKPTFNRLHSVKKIMRTLSSIKAYDLDSNWAATTPRGKRSDQYR
ncbi:Bidirectional sugar transporter SWEET16 [Linum grandiflorum]